MNIVIIGVGALGKRHLQSILNTKYDMTIYCVDAYPRALEGFETSGYEGKTIVFSTDLTEVPAEIDFALFAMSSGGRREMFEQLIAKSKVRFVLFEKVLFQKEEDYYAVQEMLQDRGIRAWVNCGRRMQPFWMSLKNEISDAEYFEFHVSGGNWGLGCNGIHMLDTIAYLAGTHEMGEVHLNLEDRIVDSKRDGYKEIYGVLCGECGKCVNYSISCYESNLPIQIELVTPDCRYVINEPKGVCQKYYSDGSVATQNFEMLYQSQMTEQYLDRIFESDDLNLASYEESMEIHLGLIRPLSKFFEEHGMEGRLCPIT